MTNKVTISTIAKEAGVSKTTISRYINGNYEFMSEATRDRIGGIIKKYDYVPNSVARTLKSKKSGMIGIVIHTMDHNVASKTVRGMNEVCTRNGYATIICCTNEDPKTEDEAIRTCLNQQVDGIIVIPCRDEVEPYQVLYDQGIPMVMCMRRIKGWEHGCVYVRHDDIIRKLTLHLKEQGFEKARFLLDVTTFYKLRMKQTFESCASEYFGMDPQESVVIVGRDENLVHKALDDCMNDYPGQYTAVMACNTHTLFLTLNYLTENGVKIPAQLGVCGYDALGWSKLVAPGITSIYQPMHGMGVCAGEALMSSMHDGVPFEEDIALDGTFSFRASTVLNS